MTVYRRRRFSHFYTRADIGLPASVGEAQSPRRPVQAGDAADAASKSQAH